MKGILALFGIVALIALFPFLFQLMDNARTDDYAETFVGVATGVGIVSGNVTLGQDLWSSAITSVNSVTSNETGDSPSANSYNGTSLELTINGLAESDNRTLTVDYKIQSPYLASVTGIDNVFVVIIYFLVLGLIAYLIGVIYSAWTNRGN